jgi:hypothetical protein
LTFVGREDRKIISQIERTLGGKLAWVNAADTGEDVPDSRSSAGRPARKPVNGSRKGALPSGKRNGQRAGGNATFADERKQRKSAAGPSKTGSRQKKNRRAAIMIDGSGNFFLNP